MAEDSNASGRLHIEILQKQNSLVPKDDLLVQVTNWLNSHVTKISLLTTSEENIITKFDNNFLSEHVLSISILADNYYPMNGKYSDSEYHVYTFNSTAPEIEEAEDAQQISTQWILPTQEFHGLWDTLIYDHDVKNELLNYVETALYFSEKGVDPNIVSWNRIILLHGPPGTGKTSLCKALAQKVCIRFSSKFAYGQLVEVNTHSLFSKWFSESGKLVTKMFHSILNLVEDPNVLVIVLLDEVETLARSRTSALSGNEPSDALRVVNALLTHLDMIKRYPNVLILTTSNITAAIDVALIDRADVKQYIGLPSVDAIYQIYFSCISELQRNGVICTKEIPWNLYKVKKNLEREPSEHSFEGAEAGRRSIELWSVATKSKGFSGRTLRKLPFLACSLFAQSRMITLDAFLKGLAKAVDKHWKDIKELNLTT